MLQLDPQQFEFIRETSWEEVFADWREKEAHQQKWISVFTQRGFSSWDEWRTTHMEPLKMGTRSWFLYRLPKPQKSIPQFYGGPFQTWREEYYGGRNVMKFSEIAQLPAIQAREDLEDLIQHFPEQTSLIGVVWDGKVVITEGMHRCCAITRAAQMGQAIESNITIALSSLEGEDLPLLTRVKKSG